MPVEYVASGELYIPFDYTRSYHVVFGKMANLNISPNSLESGKYEDVNRTLGGILRKFHYG